ncbi:protein FAM8A1 [Halictus rubicundus]|uniref:protein FAM8A1 n=1 Tax=Halictus rubicundus TaxID=77578 RepID=UPI0040361610
MADDNNEEVKDDKSNESKEPIKMTVAEERTEYFKKLEKWLHEAYAWQSMATMFPYYLMSGQILNPQSDMLITSSNAAGAQRLILGANGQQNDPLRQRRAQEPMGPLFQPPGVEGFEYRIPRIWKRFAAEFIDFTMLFLLKFSIAFIGIDVSDFIDIDDLWKNFRLDNIMTLEMTYGMIVLPTIHCVIACFYEAMWLQHGVNGRIGGATPGKSMMGLRVVQCRNITPVDRPDSSDVVRVTPGTDLGLHFAFERSTIKNMVLAFFFPICFALFFFRFNRGVYDLLCNSIVVEDPYRNLNNNRLHQQ